VKVLGALYPFVTFVVILGTGNHYVLDAAGGLGALALGFLTSIAITRHRPFAPEPLDSEPLAPPPMTPAPA
jgi:hypothetical protein